MTSIFSWHTKLSLVFSFNPGRDDPTEISSDFKVERDEGTDVNGMRDGWPFPDTHSLSNSFYRKDAQLEMERKGENVVVYSEGELHGRN